jgi:selenocysteine-specific elongation factor
MSVASLVAATALMPGEVEQGATSAGLVTLGAGPQLRLVDRDWSRGAITRITNFLRAFHRDHPLAAGVSKEELRSRELPGAPPFLLDALLGRAAGIVTEGETVRLASHQVVLKEDEEQALAAIERLFRDSGLTVPAVNEALAKSGIEPARARTLLQMLIRQARLVKVAEDLVFHRSALDHLRERLAPQKGKRLTVPQFKDLAGVSRKYAIPLLEYLDRERVTRREGDERVVL